MIELGKVLMKFAITWRLRKEHKVAVPIDTLFYSILLLRTLSFFDELTAVLTSIARHSWKAYGRTVLVLLVMSLLSLLLMLHVMG